MGTRLVIDVLDAGRGRTASREAKREVPVEAGEEGGGALELATPREVAASMGWGVRDGGPAAPDAASLDATSLEAPSGVLPAAGRQSLERGREAAGQARRDLDTPRVAADHGAVAVGREKPDAERLEGPTGEGRVVQAGGVPVVPVAQEALGGARSGVDGEGAGPRVPKEEQRAVFLVPAGPDVGVAAFRRGAFGLVVLDRRTGIPAAPEGGTWLQGAVSMTLRMPLSGAEEVRVRRVAKGWEVEKVAQSEAGALIPEGVPDGLMLPMARPGRAVAILDPVTGGTLLVGTSLSDGRVAGVQTGRRTPEYWLMPSWLGVAVEPMADRVDVRAVPGGFVLAGVAPKVLRPGGAMSRRFDFPDLPVVALQNRLRAALAGAAASAPRARTRDRLAAVQAMVALGMGVEADSLVALIASEDPQAAQDAQVSGLAGVAAVLAGRYGEAAGLDDVRLGGTDEVLLWRGLRDLLGGRETVAARELGRTAPLAASYPETLRRIVWPVVAEAAVDAGLPVEGAPLPPFVAARAIEKAGKVDEALAGYDAVVAGSDRLARVRAAERAIELRLAAGRIGPVDAAAALERLSYAWRGDGREPAWLLRAAALRGVGKEWRGALDALSGIATRFPDQKAAAQAAKSEVLRAMLEAEGDGLSALQLVMLAADHADAVGAGAPGGALARLLADRLTALDLPARAIPILQGLMQAAAGEGRAEFGGRLAQLLLEGGNAGAALTALDASGGADLPAAMEEGRGLLRARALAGMGQVGDAAAGLFVIGTAAADDLRASLLAGAGDWRGCLAALADLAMKRVPAAGLLDDAAQEVLMRQARAAVEAPDPTFLRVLERSAGRLTGVRGDLFRVLTAAPFGGARDLPRAARELTLARSVPQRLQALKGP